MVRYVTNKSEFEALLETSKSKLCVIDFTATWCGPCKFIAPVFEKMAEENPDVEFVKVDVDDASDVAEACGISSMPTFQFYKGGVKVKEFSGANANQLKDVVAQLK